MSDNTPRLGLPELAQMQEMDSAQINEALVQIDALSDLSIKGLFVNDPPASPADGDAYVTGGAPMGAWTGNAYKIAYCIDGGWRIFTPFDGLVAHRADTDSFVVYRSGQWTGLGALMAGPEESIASAATCNICAAGGLCVQITGTTTIASLGGGTNALRLVRFADALTLTHDGASLVLPGGTDIVTAAGDMAGFRSDASGNWRCLFYARADGRMVNMADPVFTGAPSIAHNADGEASLLLTNTHGGGAASAAYIAYNGTGSVRLSQLGASYSPSGIYRAGGAMVAADGAGGLTLATTASQPLYFAVNNSEAARIGTDGSLLVGQTVDGGWTGSARMEIKAGSGQAISGWATTDGVVALRARVDTAAGYLAYFNYGAGANVGSVTTNGTATFYNTTSDGRLKTVLADQADYRAAIQALWVGDFAWKTTGEKAFGVIAQQAWQHMPWHMGVTRPAKSEDAWHASAEPFGHLALWGVKDLYALVEKLAARVAELESRHAG